MTLYTQKEVSELLKIDVHNFPILRETGMLVGIKTGKGGWLYREEELQKFWTEYLGEDIGSAEKIRIVAALHRKVHDGKQVYGDTKKR